jgi:hypothetical protein
MFLDARPDLSFDVTAGSKGSKDVRICILLKQQQNCLITNPGVVTEVF